VTRIDAYRTGNATLSDIDQPEPDQVFNDLDQALAERPELVVVANPTALHIPTALAAVRAGCHVLVEKPLSNTLSGCAELAEEVRTRGVVLSVACNLRFYPMLCMLQEWVRTGGPLGEPISGLAHFGTYLPDWHPWEDFRTSYAARRELGGGAALTLVHEIDCMLWMFGPAERFEGIALGKHPLGVDVDEACAIVIRHRGGALSTITLSLAQKPARRTIEITFTGGMVTCDLLTGRWIIRYADGQLSEGGLPEGFDFDHTYRDQAAAFLLAIRREDPATVSVDEGIAALKVALSVKE